VVSPVSAAAVARNLRRGGGAVHELGEIRRGRGRVKLVD
jgi:hypothetical protein